MSAVIQNEYTQNDTTTVLRPFTFPYLKTSDIKVSLDGVETTAFTLANATTIQFNSVPPNGAKIKIFRQTSVDDLTATFYAGSAIKSEDLNDNFTQNLYKTQEVGARFVSKLGSTMTGDLTMGAGTDIVFEGATDDAHETTLTVADPTADRTITFPNVTGNVVTTGDTASINRTMLVNDIVDGTKIADDSIDSEHYVDGSIDTAHIANSAVTGGKIASNAVDSVHYTDASIDTRHIADSQITTAKLATNSVTNAKIVDLDITGSKIASTQIDSRHYINGSIDNAHLADNAVTQAKMADDSVGAAELVDASVGEVALAANSVTNAKMADSAVGTSELVDAAVTTPKIADNAVTMAKLAGGTLPSDIAVVSANITDGTIATDDIADNAVTTGKIQDGELKTLAGMQSGTASKLASGQTLTADINDLNQIDGLTKQTTISDSDASFPTSGAVVDYVAAQIAPLGGLEVIATEVAFPNTQPASGVVISISDAAGVVVNGSGTSTTGRTVGGSTVTINNFPSSLNSETLATGVGLMVSSTGSSQVYNYHKILAAETDVKQLSDDINDFQARYRVGSSNPTSALDGGDLFFNTTTGKLLVYNNTNTAWEEAQSIGNFFISTLSPAFDGSTQNFTLTNAPTTAQQIILSINGVVQKPNAGTSTPSEGFALSGSTVKLSAAPAAGDSYHAVVMGSTVNIGTPSNNTVSTAIIQNGAVTTDKIADDAVTADKLAHTSVTAGSYSAADITVDAQGRITAASSGSITTSELTDNAVTTAKLNSSAVTNAKLASNSVATANLQDGAVQTAKLAANAVQTSQITDGNVTTAKIANNAITSDKIAGSSVQTSFIADDAVTGAKIASNAIDSEHYATGSIDTTHIADQAVTLAKLPHGTSSNDGKFLRANNGADPSFETVTGTTINNNADNRVITGDANANTLNGETNLHAVNGRLLIGTSSEQTLPYTISGAIQTLGAYNTSSINIVNNENSGNTSALTFNKIRGASGGVSASDNMGGINWGAYDGSAWRSGITVEGKLTGSGANNVPSKLTFKVNSGSSNTERFAITPNGVTFNGDTAAANALDDYEEGTWTPIVATQNGTSNATLHYNNGYYTKIGRIVYAHFYIHWSGATNHSGYIYFNGFPYNSANISLNNSVGNVMLHSLPFPSGYTSAALYMGGNSPGTNLYFSKHGSGWAAGSNVNSGEIIGSITYLAA